MRDGIRVKICGLTAPEHVSAAAAAGAAYAGFVFFPKSPRHLAVAQAAALAAAVPPGICKVALSVDATDADLERILLAVPIDMLQLHGNESPDRVRAVKARFGLPVMKAVGLSEAADMDKIDSATQALNTAWQAASQEMYQAAQEANTQQEQPGDQSQPGGNGNTDNVTDVEYEEVDDNKK